MKVCTRCRQSKPETGFPRDKSRADGLRIWCKECANEKRLEWYDSSRRTITAEVCAKCGELRDGLEYRRAGAPRSGKRRICQTCIQALGPDEKICSKCLAVKPLSEYHPHTQTKDGKQPSCKACSYQTKLRSQERYPERHRERMQRIVRRSHVRRKYGLERVDYDALVEQAGGRCQSCGEPERIAHKDGTVWPLCVDHDHVTGAVRGLLCHACNRAAGAVGDDFVKLRAIADYLERRKGP